VRADADEVLGAEERTVEVLDLEQQRLAALQLGQQHVVVDARVEPLVRKVADREIDGLLAVR
jgi:hypothetical protein